MPTGEQSPGPCQAVLTPKNSHSAATFRAMLRPPICEMWIRMKSISRSAISGTYSCCVLNSSPIASGTLDCWRISRKWSFSSGGSGSSRKNRWYFSSSLHRLTAWLGEIRS